MDSRLIRRPKALLLKDYLLDDMSSCSSNGFKSFPRRQCCTNVRFVREFNPQNKHKKFNKTTSDTKSRFSAFQSIITAVKHLPFSSAKSPPEKKKTNNSFLPRSFSKKLLRKSNFWKRKSEREEIRWWTSFNHVVKDYSEPSDRSSSSITTRNSKTNSWSESDFTVSDGCSTGNSSSEVNLNLPDESNDGVVKMPINDNGVVVTNGDVSTDSTTSSDGANSSTNSKKQWSSEEKEQFSPVSVLDCPFDDDDEVSSPFQDRLARMEGTKKNLLKKIQRFECLAKLEPVNLGTQFVLQPADSSDNESSSASIDDKLVSDIEKKEDEEEKALKLLHQMKTSSSSYADKLLLDFFRERIISTESSFHEARLLEEAEDWINGRNRRELEWGVQKNRQAYVKEMEGEGEWKTLDQENQEVVFELETEVFAGLLNELLMDISSMVTI